MIVTCGDSECQYYNHNRCTAPAVDHTAGRFCTTGRRRPRDDIKGLMRESEPKGRRKAGKWVGN